ncbi:MAG: hypothetical protein Q7V88_05645 [Actinomycetota bacterium]|nr:hypothetical protein [Actinomycetota bacterium]
MIRLDAATVLLQWAAGGLLFLWFTTRRREVGVGYGWLLRGTYMLLAAGAALLGLQFEVIPLREAASVATAVAALATLVLSILRRKAGVAGQLTEHDRRSERVAAMTGIERGTTVRTGGREYPPILDLVGLALAAVGLVAAALDAGGNALVSLLRVFAGAAFLGAVTDAMLLGHWYLVQPGLPRRHLNELVKALGWVWPIEVAALLLPTGMLSVWSGTVDDGWSGQLGWFWAACAVSTIVLVMVTRAALRERYYSAVMAATGLLYLAILTAFGTDLVARAILAG